MRYGRSCDARGFGSKKTLLAIEQARADVARRRQRWRSWQPRLDPRRLVFIDETWIKTNMAPLRGWGPKGKRLRGFTPHGHWRTLTFLAALRCDRLTAPCVFDGPINGQCFRAYVEQQLVPAFYDRDDRGIPRRWLQIVKESIRTVLPRFSTRRMVKEYVRDVYLPALREPVPR